MRKLIEGVETRKSKLRIKYVVERTFFMQKFPRRRMPLTIKGEGQEIVRALWKHSELDDKELLE